jgi:hypothetical protein
MEYLSFFTGVLSIAVLVIMQMILFKFLDTRKVMVWLIGLIIIGEVINVVVILFIKIFIYKGGNISIWESFFVSTMIYGSLALFYITLIGISVTSLRVQILHLIMTSKRPGISYMDIFSRYKKSVIVKTRLERLIASGILRQDRGYYYVKNPLSFFVFYTYFFILLRYIYSSPIYEKKLS